MKSQFVPANNPILNKISKPIPKSQINSPGIKETIEIMLRAAQVEQKRKKKPILVGLAAPQIGILKRIILVDTKADGQGKTDALSVYINPEITWSSKKKGDWYEGCYSTSRICGIVSRPLSIKVEAFTQTGFPHLKWERRVEKYKGYVARIFQHEIDHLNGIRFPELIKDPNKLHWVNKNEFKLYRNKQAWKNWPKKCSFQKWKKIKKPLLNGI